MTKVKPKFLAFEASLLCHSDHLNIFPNKLIPLFPFSFGSVLANGPQNTSLAFNYLSYKLNLLFF